MEDKRVEQLVLEGLNDKNVTPLIKADFAKMKSNLRNRLKHRQAKEAV
jgi:hypothetical protein